MNDPKSYDALSSVVFLVGLFEGLLPFPAKLIGFTPLLSLPSRMDAPAWWIVSGAVLIGAVIALDHLDRAKKRRFGSSA